MSAKLTALGFDPETLRPLPGRPAPGPAVLRARAAPAFQMPVPSPIEAAGIPPFSDPAGGRIVTPQSISPSERAAVQPAGGAADRMSAYEQYIRHTVDALRSQRRAVQRSISASDHTAPVD